LKDFSFGDGSYQNSYIFITQHREIIRHAINQSNNIKLRRRPKIFIETNKTIFNINMLNKDITRSIFDGFYIVFVSSDLDGTLKET